MQKSSVAVVALLLLALIAWQVRPLPEVGFAVITESELHDVPIHGYIELEFNRGAKPQERIISMEPPIDYIAEWSEDGKKVVLTPTEPLEYNSQYKIKGENFEVRLSTMPVPTFTLAAGGDVLLDKMPGENIALHGPEYVFKGLGELFTGADIAFANLESPASNGGAKITPKNFTFRSTPEALDSLVAASIDVVSFTNNHCLDFGEEAFLDTMEHLSERGIAYVGAGRNRGEALSPYITYVNGVRVAFLAFMQKSFLPAWSYDFWEAQENKPGVIFLDGDRGRQDILNAVKETKLSADVVLVSLHWGYEGLVAPQAWQRQLAKDIIDVGATAIIGHHPHLPFGVEFYKDKPVIYSLGNFLFHPYDPAARESFVAHMTIDLYGDVDISLHPILMERGTVRLLEGGDADSVLNVVRDRSARLGASLVRQGDTLIPTR